MMTGSVCHCDSKTKFCSWCDPQRVIKSLRSEIESLKADRKDRLIKLDREYRNGFRAGWNAGINGDEDLLRQVNERPNK